MEKKITFTPHGVCSRQIENTLDGDLVKQVEFVGGCPGNTHGVAALVEGMPVEEVIRRLGGIDCRGRGTSCPNELAKALRENL